MLHKTTLMRRKFVAKKTTTADGAEFIVAIQRTVTLMMVRNSLLYFKSVLYRNDKVEDHQFIWKKIPFLIRSEEKVQWCQLWRVDDTARNRNAECVSFNPHGHPCQVKIDLDARQLFPQVGWKKSMLVCLWLYLLFCILGELNLYRTCPDYGMNWFTLRKV